MHKVVSRYVGTFCLNYSIGIVLVDTNTFTYSIVERQK